MSISDDKKGKGMKETDSSWKSSAYAECSVRKEDASRSEHKITKDKYEDSDKEMNKYTAQRVVKGGCRLSAAECEYGHVASVAAQTQRPYATKGMADMINMVNDDHASPADSSDAAALPEKFEFGVRDSGEKSPRGVFTMVDHGRAPKRTP